MPQPEGNACLVVCCGLQLHITHANYCQSALGLPDQGRSDAETPLRCQNVNRDDVALRAACMGNDKADNRGLGFGLVLRHDAERIALMAEAGLEEACALGFESGRLHLAAGENAEAVAAFDEVKSECTLAVHAALRGAQAAARAGRADDAIARATRVPDDATIAQDAKLVIADISDPASAGTTIEALRRTYAAPILALSARFRRGLGGSSEPAQRLHVGKVLPKPFTREELLCAVREATKKAAYP